MNGIVQKQSSVLEVEKRRRSLRDLLTPEPAAGLDSYRHERELALSSDPRRKKNYDHYIASTRRSAQVDYLPIKLDIENVSRCNFRCIMCVVGDWPKGKRAEDMPLEEYKRLIDEQYGLLEIKLQGIGEPLLQRDEFFEMIRYARARHIWVRTTTNASLLHVNDNCRKLIDSGVNEVQISIDGATREVFESIRVGSVFRQVVANCRTINAYCRELGIERTKMWTVVQRANHDQLEALVDLAADLGFTNQVFSLELSDWGMDEMRSRNSAVNVEVALDAERLLGLVDRGERCGVRVRFWSATERYRLGDRSTLCPWPFERAYVSSDARVVPCCYIGNPDVCEVEGKLTPERGFTDVWMGKSYAAFREAHLSGNLPKICEGCYALGSSPSPAQSASWWKPT
jgi:pyrroloquinoline quinone biosynthesis protein E